MSSCLPLYAAALLAKAIHFVNNAAMNNLIMIPAMGCNFGLYEEMAEELRGLVQLQVHIPTENRFEKMVKTFYKDAPDEFILLGTSMGGRLAMEIAMHRPHRAQGLIVIGANPGAVADRVAGMRRTERLRSKEFEDVLFEMGAMMCHMAGPRGQQSVDKFKSMAREVGPEVTANQSDALAFRRDQWTHLEDLTCPTLCLWGRYDKLAPRTDGEKLAKSVARGRYVEISDCGHLPTLEYPRHAAGIIVQFLRDANLV
jgi:pimeloyl-ACP methyl ester carboxylesterase